MAIIKLGEMFDITGGSTPSTSEPKLWNKEILWYQITDLKNNTSTEKKISKEFKKDKLVPKGSVLFSCTASIGYIGLAKDDCWHSQQIRGFINKDKNKIINIYFYYLLLKNSNNIEKLGSGSVFKNIAMEALKTFDLNVPDIKIQQSIIDIIEPIELLMQLSIKIKTQLVNFKKNIIPVFNHLEKNKVQIKDIVKLKNGSNPPDLLNLLKKHGNQYSSVSDLEGNYIYKTKKRLDKGYDFNGLIGNKDELFITSIGTPAIVHIQKSEEEIFFSSQFMKITCDDEKVFKNYLFYKLISEKLKLKTLETGSVIKFITIQSLNNYRLQIPDYNVQKKLDNIIEKIEILFEKNENILKKLNIIKNNLLKLLIK